MNIPIATKITEVIHEAKGVKTFTFFYPDEIIPGQFFMIWVPEVDEIPMSVSIVNGDQKGITFRKIGEATNALFNLKKGDKIGVRGPYGNGFTLQGKNILFVGGGTGIAMLAPLIQKAKKIGIKSSVIIGAKTKKEIIFEKRISNYCNKLIISTDDGSCGESGLASEIALNILKKEKIDSINTCGPELMMKSLLDFSNNIYFQASLERYMKCAIGLCGQCCIGEGIRVCKEGPIFDGKKLRQIEDFGKFKRDAAGRKISF